MIFSIKSPNSSEDTTYPISKLDWEMMIKKGKKVGMYPISENSFLDMGELEEMKKMEERVVNYE